MMATAMRIALVTSFLIMLGVEGPPMALAAVSENLLKNPSFEEGLQANGAPVGWSLYQPADELRRIELVEPGSESAQALLIRDDSTSQEIGVYQDVPADGGLTYEAAVMVYVPEGASGAGAHIQLRFSPSGAFEQGSLAVLPIGRWTRVAVVGTAPDGTKSARIYLYTHRDPTPRVIVDQVSLVSGVPPPAPPPPPPPEPVPPQYDRLKDLCVETSLVAGGQANALIVTPASGRYDRQAEAIAAAIERITGVKLPVVRDDDSAAAVPITDNLICLGNRSTNATIAELYNRFHTLLDLRYPGRGGYEVRTLHNPFGDRHNVVFVGGSEDAGVAEAARVLVQHLAAAGGRRGELTIGRLADIKLGEGISVPHDINALEIWEASKGYGSVGYFGWCSISKRLAAYYMTGDEFHAREFLRLAFPDAQALKEIAEIDGERIENKDDPLAGFYHYNAHMAILFWDLVEESPFFDDQTRLKVTNAFARQLNHRKNEGVYSLTRPAPVVGSRHGQYSAISLFCLGRYFNTYYPNPIWEQCVRGAWNHFASLGDYAWVSGEADNLFWYSTGTAPVLTWMLLSGDRRPLQSGALEVLLRAQDALISGLTPDWALNSASLDYLHKAAYLTGDGRWLEYRNRTGVDLSVFRLGQSFWPDESTQPRLPTELVGKWTINPLALPMWQARGSGLPFEQSFQWGSFRSAADASGDFILIDGYNGASRNPYHTFALLELRLNGATLLKGYRNQVLTKADGMVEPQVAMDGALRYRDVLGDTAVAVGGVPKAAFCDWQRSLVQRVGRYGLVVDDLAFRTDSDNLEVQVLWETAASRWDAQRQVLVLSAIPQVAVPRGWFGVRALDAQCASHPAEADSLARLDSINTLLLRATDPGSWLELPFTLPQDMEGEVFVDMVDYSDRGVVRFRLDGEPVGPEHAHFSEAAVNARLSLGRHALRAGPHRLRVEVVRLNPRAPRANIGLSALLLRPLGAPEAQSPAFFALTSSKPVSALRSGPITTMQWFGPVQKGEHVRFFSVIGPDEGGALASYELAENAAALRLPNPALAVVGSFGATEADLAVLADDHLYAHRLTRAGVDRPLISASEPIAVDWNFSTGLMHVAAGADTNLMVRTADARGVTLNGQATTLRPDDDGMLSLDLPAGRHLLEGVRPEGELANALADLLEQGARIREQQLAAVVATGEIAASELARVAEAQVGGSVLQMLTIPEGGGEVVCVAEGRNVHVLDATGRELRKLQADGNIRVIHWWPTPDLLLVGCDDEQVIAFDRAGRRKWVFVSEMDPAVFRAAKTYWFKSDPTHKGIWGVTAGRFIKDEEQAIIGSACTLEFVDSAGKLVHRMPQFWGDPHVFQFIPKADGSINLLAARRINDNDTLGVINNRTLDPNPRGFYTVPAGHTYVSGWSSMNRYHIFREDLDGDGVHEVISEKNGSWNRVTVWDEAGNAKWDASFGPGANSPTRNMRDLVIADLDGDGSKEIITATSAGLVVALTYRCEKFWSRRLPSPPNVMAAFPSPTPGRPWLVVGCDNGAVYVLDGAGAVVRTARLEAQVQDIASLAGAGAPLAVLGSAQGQVALFEVR